MSRTLILVPCHGIWLGERVAGFNPSSGDSRDEWALAPFQIEGNDHLCFKEHLIQAAAQVKTDPNATLVISGGQTKKECRHVSEASSYFSLLTQLTNDKDILERTYLEEYARDSFENVLFLFCRFFELYGAYPDHVKIMGFEFKRRRFVELHLETALEYVDCEYIGNQPRPDKVDDKRRYFADLENSEYSHAVRHFESDWYGVQCPLIDKRKARDPFGRQHSYADTNPTLAPLLRAIGGTNKTSEEIRNMVDFPWSQS